ncbi:hypothetical protein [Streptomyces sp. Amel2xC10]|uniref:hypothetical protein n=1 Tax=Streptomyces sp. Amel2xC10 TaxID=1305826 RepID=UPI000A151A68|nr:hypothetical protein [Streptomyces sp. Amel2xC10]
MLDMSDEALAVVERSFTMDVRAECWLGGELITDAIPVTDGSEDRDRSLGVPERISLTVPRRDRGVTWDPGADPAHPLAAYGQQLRIDYGVQVGSHWEWINRGWFLITNSDVDGDTVSVELQGLLTLIDEAKLVAPFQPSTTDTLASTARALVEPALTCAFDGALVDRAASSSMQWDSDRMEGLNDIASAWAAEYRVTEDALLLWAPLSDTGDPVLTLTDGVGGTVIRWQGSTTREGAFNVVVSQGEDSAGNQIQGVAYDEEAGSPFLYGGPFNALPVPYTESSPLLTTVAQCRTAARATLQRLRRANGRRLGVTMVPHPGLMTGDIVSVTGQGLRAAPCVIESLSLPYSPDEMSLTVRVLPS